MIYAFGELELDDALMELRLRGRPQTVPPRVLRAMLYLIRNRTRTISRDELAESVWDGLAVSDAALSQAIMLARKVSLDVGDQQRVIKTVRGLGFRFVAAVVERASNSTAGLAGTVVPPATAPLLGREREIALLRALLVGAQRGHGGLVLLEGEPGIGKTRLAESFCAEAESQGALVLWGRCWEEGGAPAFWPFTQVLRALVAHFSSETVRGWLGTERDLLLTLLPELAEGERTRSANTQGLAFGSSQTRFRAFDAIARLLTRAAHALQPAPASDAERRRTLVVVLEDLHAADEASLQLLRFLTPELRAAPLAVLATFRDLEVAPEGALAALLGGPLENCQRITPNRLEQPEVARLAEQLTGQPVSTSSADLLHQVSGGNPFLLSELVRAAQRGLELSALTTLRVPERMARAVRRRLEGHDETARGLLEIAAALGREFSLASLSSTQGCSQQELLHVLDGALSTGVIEPIPGSAGARLRFAHALVRDTIYGDLPISQRIALHLRIAEALEASCDRDHQPVHELARHFYLAAPTGCAAKAIDYALRAATQAEQMLAFDSAGNLRDQAIELANQHERGPSLYELLLGAGSAWYRAGDLDKASARLGRAAELALAQSDGMRLAVATGFYARVLRGAAVHDARFLQLVRPTLAALGPSDNGLKAVLLGYRSLTLDSYGAWEERDDLTRRGVEMARRLRDGSTLMAALGVRRWLMAGVLPPSETAAISGELMALAREARRSEPLLDGLFGHIQDLLELGEVEQAEREIAEYSALAVEKRHLTHQFWSLLMQATQHTWCGRFTEAREFIERARSLGQRIREPTADALHAVQCWNVRTLCGAGAGDEEAPRLLPEGRDSYASRCLWLQMLISEERYELARPLYERFAAQDFADMPSDPFRRTVLASLSTACAAFDDTARAPKLYQLLAADAELFVLASLSWAIVGPVSWVLARLALTMRDHELAARHFEHALSECTRIGARPLRARLQYEYAHALQHRPGRHQKRATQLLSEALRTSRELGIAETWPLPPAAR